MVKQSKPSFVITKLQPWLDKLWQSLRKDGLKVGTGGVNIVVPIGLGDEPVPTRIGIDPSDKQTPFVETRLEPLYGWYYGYRKGRLFHEWLAYADVLLLKKGDYGFQSGQDVNDFVVIIRKDAYSVPHSLREHQSTAVQLFKDIGRLRKIPNTDEYENDISARIISWSSDSKQIEIQSACYFDQVATNLTLDWASGYIYKGQTCSRNATIRGCVERPVNGMLPPLQESILANTLGVAAILRTADDQLLIPIRGDNQAIFSRKEGQFHCSASGVFKWKYVLDAGEQADFDVFSEGMRDEIYRELNLPRDSYILIPLAFARELARGGKPQLFFIAECKLTLAEVKQYMKDAEENWEFLDEKDLPPESPLTQWLDDQVTPTYTRETLERCFTIEGWMALRLAQAYRARETIL